MHSPSLAPVVMVTSVSGSSLRPQVGEYASAMAFLRRGRPLVGLYWLHSTRSRASLAAWIMNGGGLYPKKPWPRFTMGWFGDDAAASLMMDLYGDCISWGLLVGLSGRPVKASPEFLELAYQTSCLCPATRAAGLSFAGSPVAMVDEYKARCTEERLSERERSETREGRGRGTRARLHKEFIKRADSGVNTSKCTL